MSETLIALLRKVFPALAEKHFPTSVESAISALDKAKTKLRSVEAKSLAKAAQLRADAEAAIKKAEAHAAESARALKVGDKLHELLN